MFKQLQKLILVVLMLATLLPSSSYAWYNCTWLKRTAITITNSSGAAQSNYHLELRLLPSNMPSYVWANGDNDMRFVASDDTTLLQHFSMPRLTSTQEVLVWVNIPSLPTGPTTIYLYYDNASAASTSTTAFLTTNAIRYHTKQSSVGNVPSYEGWWSAWNGGLNTTGYGCKLITDFTNISNNASFTGGSGANIVYYTTTVLTPNTSATWRFRDGPDFGWGGGFYLNDVALQTQWSTDIWWNANWGGDAGSTQTLYGTRAVASGSNYVVRSLGGEGGSDGPAAIQFSRTATAGWLAASTANFTLKAPKCEVAGIGKDFGPAASGDITLNKTILAYSDPINGTTNPKLIPEARARYTLTAINNGGAGSDAGSFIVRDPIPTGTKLYVNNLAAAGPVIFTQGTPSSGLTYTFASLASTADDISFSNNGGVSYAYTPVPDADGYDTSVTHIAVNPKGQFACATGTKPSFSLQFDVGVK